MDEGKPEIVEQIRARGLDEIEYMEMYLKALKDEFASGALTSIYVDEKAGCLAERAKTLEALAKRRMDETWGS